MTFCAWLYWPGIHGPFMLDDNVNLRHLESLDTSAQYLGDIVKGNVSGPLGRPLSMLSFAASYAAAGSSPFVFKLHNLVLHLLTGSAAFWFAYLVACRRLQTSPLPFAFFSSALWILSPLLLSTVLYPVQRMTQLSAMFMLFALIAYCKGRAALERSPWQSTLSMVAAAALSAAAVLSKENGVVIVLLVILTELAVFRPPTPSTRYRRVEQAVLIALALSGVAILLALAFGYGSSLIDYSRRDFTMSERLITQARVMWDYLIGFALPIDRGYGLYHDDFVVSRSLFDSALTAAAVCALLMAAGCCAVCLFTQRGTLVAYGVGFFLVGHLVESTVFPLELYFEHRNYLPSVGLAIAFAACSRAIVRRVVWAALPVRLVQFSVLTLGAINTGLLSATWSNGHLLAARNIVMHPESPRANAAMAVLLSESGYPQAAVAFSDKSVDLGALPESTRELRRLAMYCMARQPPVPDIMNALKANLGQVADVSSNEAVQLFAELVADRGCDESSTRQFGDMIYERFVSGAHLTPTVLASMVKVENVLGNYARAMDYAEALVSLRPRDATATMMVMYFAWQTNDVERIQRSLERLSRLKCEHILDAEQLDVFRQFATAAEARSAALRPSLACP